MLQTVENCPVLSPACLSPGPLWREECEGQAHLIPLSRLSWQHVGSACAQGFLGHGCSPELTPGREPSGFFPGKPKAVNSFLNPPGCNSVVVIQDC